MSPRCVSDDKVAAVSLLEEGGVLRTSNGHCVQHHLPAERLPSDYILMQIKVCLWDGIRYVSALLNQFRTT